MPQFLQLPPVASAIVTILGVVVAVTRLLTASRPIWSVLPAWAQKAIPAVLVGLGLIPPALEHATSWLDVAQAVILAIGAFYTASRGDKRPPVDKDGGPRTERTNSDPKLTRDELAPPPSVRPEGGMDAECIALPWWAFVELQLARRRLVVYSVGPAAMLVFGVAALNALACDPRKPPCDESKLQQIDRAYVARVATVCLAKYDSKEECPEFPALKADHRRELREECGR